MPKEPYDLAVPKLTQAHLGALPLAPANKTLHIPVPCARRAALFHAHLVAAYTTLRDWGTGGGAPKPGRLRYAISGQRLVGLLEDLAEVLDDYVAYGVQEDFRPGGVGAAPPTYDAYFDTQINAGPGVPGFFARYPLLNNALTTLRTYFINNLDTALNRINADWNELETGFINPGGGDVLRALIHIQTTGSDFHKRGKQVLILTFAYTTPNPPAAALWRRRLDHRRKKAIARRTTNALNHPPWTVKVVYKPTDVEIDARIMGDTARLTAARGGPGPEAPAINPSLMELMNVRLGLAAPETLPTYLIIPHNAGSTIAANPPGAAIGNSYGYIEFLTHEPAQHTYGGPLTAAGGLAQVQAACNRVANWRANNPFDFVVATHAEAQTAFRTWGRLCAIAVIFSIADMHAQNVIIHGGKPHLIDLEDSCKWRMTAVSQTGMFGGVPSASCDADLAPNPLANAKQNDKQKTLTCGPLPGPHKYSNTILYEWPVGNPAPNRVNKAAMVAEMHWGFTQVFNAMAGGGVNAAVDAWAAAHLQNVITRFVAMPTGDYYLQLFSFINRNLGVAPPLTPAAVTAAGGLPAAYLAQFDNFNNWFYERRIQAERAAWLVVARTPADPEEKRQWSLGYLPTFALEHAEGNWLDIIQWDIPSFYRRLSTRDLLNSEGRALDPGTMMNVQDARAAPSLAATGNAQSVINRDTHFANATAAENAALAAAGGGVVNVGAQSLAAANAVSGSAPAQAAAQAAAASGGAIHHAATVAAAAVGATAATVAAAAAAAAATVAEPVRLQHWFAEPALTMVRRQITDLLGPPYRGALQAACLASIH